MTRFIRRHSYIRIEEDKEVWIFDDELSAAEAATYIDVQTGTEIERGTHISPQAAPRVSKVRQACIFVVTTALAVATSLIASLIYDVFTN